MHPGSRQDDRPLLRPGEETGLQIMKPILKAVSTFIIRNNDHIESEWMMFTFYASDYEGEMLVESEEGKLAWQPNEVFRHLPMAEGDRHLMDYVRKGNDMIFGTFHYTPDFKLLSYHLETS